MSTRTTFLALVSVAALAGMAATGCSSSSSGASAPSTTTAVSTSSSTATTMTTVPMTVATVAPAPPAPATSKPRPTTPAPTGPQLTNVALSGYPGGITCTPGDVLTITLMFTATNAAGVLIWSSTDGTIGQFPAEFGQADVPYTCSGMQTLFTLYPVAEGGALGTPVDLNV